MFTVNSESDSVSSIAILEGCHIPGKTLINDLYDMHLAPFNSLEVPLNTVFTVKSTSNSVSSILILEAWDITRISSCEYTLKYS